MNAMEGSGAAFTERVPVYLEFCFHARSQESLPFLYILTGAKATGTAMLALPLPCSS